MQKGGASILTILAVAIFGLLIGALAANTITTGDLLNTNGFMSDRRSPDVENTTQVGIGGAPEVEETRRDMQSDAANLRVKLNTLFHNHVNLSATSMKNSYDNSEDADAIGNAMSKNTQEIADILQAYYGGDTGERFKQTWNIHITGLNAYAVALNKNNTSAKEEALAKLDDSVEQISAFFASINDQLPKNTVGVMVNDHISMMKNMINAYDAGDFSQSYSQQTTAAEQSSKFADTIAGATIRKFPDRF